MANDIKFSSGKVKELYENLDGIFNSSDGNINSILKKYVNASYAIPTNTWKSAASTAYESAYDETVKTLIQPLTDSSTSFLNGIKESYVAFDDTEAKMTAAANNSSEASEATDIVSNFGKNANGVWNALIKHNDDSGDDYIEYIVVSGDTLGNIAFKMNTSLDNLLANNPEITDASLIHPGDVIKLPTSTKPKGGQGE